MQLTKNHKFVVLFYAYFLNLFSKAADIGFFLFVVKLLSKEDMGVFNTVMSVSALFYVLLNGGFVESAMREIASHSLQVSNVIKKCVTSRVILIIGFYSLLLLVFKLDGFSENEYLVYLSYSVGFQVVTWIQNLYVSVLKSSNRQNNANFIIAIDSLIKLLLIIGVSNFIIIDLIMLWKITIASKLVTIVIPFLINIFRLNVFKLKVNNDYFVFSGQGQFITITLFTLAQNRLDWMLIAAFLDQASVATYSVANRFYEIIIFVVGIGATTIYPWLCKSQHNSKSKKDDKNIVFLNKLQLYLGLVIIALAIKVFPYVNDFMWGGRYIDVLDVLKYVLPCLMLAITNMKLYYDILSKRKEKFIVPITFTSTLCQSIFNIYAINKYGINGAIAGMWVLNGMNVILYTVLAGEFKKTFLNYITGDIGLSYMLAFALLFSCMYLNDILIYLCVGVAMMGIYYEWWKMRSLSI